MQEEDNLGPGYDEIAKAALEVLSAFFLEDAEGEDNELMLDILTSLLGEDPEGKESVEDRLEAYQELCMKLTNMFSGMLCHVVNMIRVLAMMSMRADVKAYQSYVQYFHHLLPTWETVETEEEMMEFLERLHHYFGVEIPDEIE